MLQTMTPHLIPTPFTAMRLVASPSVTRLLARDQPLGCVGRAEAVADDGCWGPLVGVIPLRAFLLFNRIVLRELNWQHKKGSLPAK